MQGNVNPNGGIGYENNAPFNYNEIRDVNNRAIILVEYNRTANRVYKLDRFDISDHICRNSLVTDL